jgi:hypothetical protein
MVIQAGLGIYMRLYLRNNQTKKNMAQVVERLPSKHKDVSSTPSSISLQKKKEVYFLTG